MIPFWVVKYAEEKCVAHKYFSCCIDVSIKRFQFHDTGKLTHVFLYITSPSCISKVFWNTQFPTALLPYIVSFLQTPLCSGYLTTSKGFQIDQCNLGKTYIYIQKNPFDIFVIVYINLCTFKLSHGYSFHAFALCSRIKLFNF